MHYIMIKSFTIYLYYPDMFRCLSTPSTRDKQSTQPCRRQREHSTDLYTNTPTACMNLRSLRPIIDDCTAAQLHNSALKSVNSEWWNSHRTLALPMCDHFIILLLFYLLTEN
jgi:hypothetical protein